MNIKTRKAITAISLLLVFCITQVSMQVGLAGTTSVLKAATSNVDLNQLAGKLVTRGNQPIQVNGNSAKTDATVLSGASVDTPEGISATINLSPLGSLEMAPNASVRVEFREGQIKVTLIKGCIILRANRGTVGMVMTEKGEAGKTDSKGGFIDVCNDPAAAAPIVGQGAAAAAGAGAGGAIAGAVVAGGVAAGGISATTGVLIGAAAVAGATIASVVVPCRQRPNPSPATTATNSGCDRGL